MRAFVLTIFVLATVAGRSQVSEIDRAKLPSDPAVQRAYDDLLPINAYARTFEAKWRFPVPQAEVTKRLKADLQTLESAQKAYPDNTELELLTGLTAHLAYNLDVQEAYDPAMNLLGALAQKDFRAAWFLGIHQCQSNETVGGMNRLLDVEASTAKLPADFWQDYANCAQNTFMPVHAVRAWDKADALNNGAVVDPALEQIARNHIKPSSNDGKYTDKQAWAANIDGDNVRFISTLCGESFPGKITIELQLAEVSGGSCYFGITGKKYPSHPDPVSATFAITSSPAPAGQMLKDFAKAYLAKPDFEGATAVVGVPCPAAACLSFELVMKKIYWKQGGAHALIVFFASEPPDYPGLRFESPVALPKPDGKSSEPKFYMPTDVLQRLPGTRYTVIVLDANEDIYAKSRADFDAFLKTLVVDSK